MADGDSFLFPGDSFGLLDVVGFGAFVFGFFFEVIADAQKTAFRGNSTNKDKFITTGELWSYSPSPYATSSCAALNRNDKLVLNRSMGFISPPQLLWRDCDVGWSYPCGNSQLVFTAAVSCEHLFPHVHAMCSQQPDPYSDRLLRLHRYLAWLSPIFTVVLLTKVRWATAGLRNRQFSDVLFILVFGNM